MGQWKSDDPDSQVNALQAKVDTLTRTISHFKMQPPPKPRPKEPINTPVPPEKNKNDERPSWTPKDDLKQIGMYKGAKWKYCKTCRNGDSAWNKTHVTSEHDSSKSTHIQGKKDKRQPLAVNIAKTEQTDQLDWDFQLGQEKACTLLANNKTKT